VSSGRVKLFTDGRWGAGVAAGSGFAGGAGGAGGAAGAGFGLRLLWAALLLSLHTAAAAKPPPPPPQPPCFNPLNPDYEALCYSVTRVVSNVTVRTVAQGVDGALATGMSAATDFAAGSVASATPVFEYFSSDNDKFEKIPLTVPLIFRPDPAGTWLASFALPTSKYATPASAPGIIPGSDLLLEAFSPAGNATAGRSIAAYLFYTIQLATQGDYAKACASLEAALPGLGFAPVEGAWREAWVTYSTQAIVGDRINECWVEVSEKR
jgi:hypothetical protein